MMLVDESIARQNIQKMSHRITAGGATFRPHFKTHQSRAIGRWFRDYGVDRITVSSLQMAAYFAGDGWRDITVAFPVNLRETELINRLAADLSLGLVAEDPSVIRQLDRMLEYQTDLWIKIDAGYGRTGIPWDDSGSIEACMQVLSQAKRLRFRGFLAHSGHTYNLRGGHGLEKVHRETVERMQELKERFRPHFPEIQISLGDTPTCSLAGDFSGADEWRPGNFIFYDLTQQAIGSCSYDEISAVVVTPVVSVHPRRRQVVVYGGAVHFSKEALKLGEKTVYGRAVSLHENGWEAGPGEAFLIKLSQEHGIVEFVNEQALNKVKPGTLMAFFPVHSCLAADLFRGYVTLQGKKLDHLSGFNETF